MALLFRSLPRDRASIGQLARRIWKSALADRLFGHAAELGFYFLFALFPTLLCGASILGLVARSAHQISDRLLEYLRLVIPTSALATVLNTFNETAAAATSGKLTFGSIAAIWSASVGVSAIQDTLNQVFKIESRRSYLVARVYAILITMLLILLVGSGLGCMFLGDFAATLAEHHITERELSIAAGALVRCIAWALSACLLALSFATLYCWAPNWKQRHWRWLTPGTILGIIGWLVASFGLRIYLHFYNRYTVTYGSLGAVIILLIWFYCSGLMLLVGAEIDRVISESASGARSSAFAHPAPAGRPQPSVPRAN
ncbi:MAG TPA: YihY/virulence factor BrkB family protein [Terracidiphilus sp.]|nr:YihY/virulence factor BrkB family protein [Terracidiphilus sp.]